MAVFPQLTMLTGQLAWRTRQDYRSSGRNGKLMSQQYKQPKPFTNKFWQFIWQWVDDRFVVSRYLHRSLQGPNQCVSFLLGSCLVTGMGVFPPGVARQFGTAHARRAAHWLQTRFVAADESSIQWISFVQLYIDFQLSWGNPGPLVVQQ